MHLKSTIEIALEFAREKHRSGNMSIVNTRDFLLDYRLEEKTVINLLGYVHTTDISDEHILDNIEKDIYYKDFKKNPDLNRYISKNKEETKREEKEDLEGVGWFLVFWAGVATLFFSIHLAILLFFISAVLAVKDSQQTQEVVKKDRFYNMKLLIKIIWVFVFLCVMALISIAVSYSQ